MFVMAILTRLFGFNLNCSQISPDVIRIHILKNPKDIYSQKSNKIIFGVFADVPFYYAEKSDGFKFLHLNFNTSFQFVFHKRNKGSKEYNALYRKGKQDDFNFSWIPPY